MKYEVTGYASVMCVMQVEAESEEQAIEIANDEFGSLTNYVGMGGTDKMIGVYSSENRSIYPDSEVEFESAEKI